VPEIRPQMIVRETLLQRLQQHDGPTVVVAPPGFGKSTLLASWARHDKRNFTWVTLEPADNDPVVLWSSIVGAVREVEADIEGAIRPGMDLVAGPVPQLLNAIEACEPLVFVLDDYHCITEPACHRTIEFLVEHAPPNLTFAVSSRTDPPLPLERMRAGGKLLDLTASELSFTLEEASRFLNDLLDLGLSTSAVEILHARTEGWPAGLYLAYLSLRESTDPDALIEAFDGSSHHVADYLSEVVLDSLDDATRDFLLATSILERLSGPLCDAVTGHRGSAQVLLELEHSNHFLIPLDDHRHWYRYHRLFAGQLTDALRRRDPDSLPALHRRAYAWFAEAGDHDAAIRHAIHAGDLEEATVFVCERYLPTIEWGGFSTVARWVESFPREWVDGDARLSIVEAWVMSFLNRRADAEAALEHAASTKYDGPLPDGATSLAASLALVRAGFPWDDVGEMLAAARRAYRLESRAESMWTVTVHVQLGWALCLSGRFEEARRYLEQGASRAPPSQQWLNAFGAHSCLAWVYLEANDPHAAEDHAREAIRILEEHDLDSVAGGWGRAMLGAVLARRGRAREADELLAHGIRQLRTAQPLSLIHAMLEHAVVRRSLGAHSDARALVSEAREMLRAFRDAGAVAERAEAVSRLVAHVSPPAAGTDLTEREFDVLRLLEKGLSKREIGQTLFLSYNTIHSHARSIYRKLGASSREEAIAQARGRGLI
jgi:LuxR family transcriptional regulator, maltose regulon positive regulatory protein